ncbi:MAG TPA: lysylphosphatidylglycerol synthase domain-containing protein [Gaiellaceae bacterium]|nr:lysylphosphatidylglycerol synthase domain-containing protein [Gaiellaceae bacterium]
MALRRSSSGLLAPHGMTALVAVAAALAAGALVGLAWTVGFGAVLHRLIHPHWFWLWIAIAGEAVAYVGYTAAYREVATAEDGAELRVPLAAALVSTGFGVFVHSGGFALDRIALERAGLSATEARRRVLGLGALEYAVLAPATLVAAVVVVFFHPGVSSGLTFPWIIGVPAGTALALTALHWRTVVTRWPLIGKRLEHGLHALQLVLRLVTSPLRYGLGVVGAVAYWAGDIFCLWAALHAFSAHTPPVAQLIVGYSTGYAITRRALPLGGAGVVEALLPFALGWVGIALAPALLAVFAYRLINLWLPIVPALGGIPALRRLEEDSRTRRSGKRTRDTHRTGRIR